MKGPLTSKERGLMCKQNVYWGRSGTELARLVFQSLAWELFVPVHRINQAMLKYLRKSPCVTHSSLAGCASAPRVQNFPPNPIHVECWEGHKRSPAGSRSPIPAAVPARPGPNPGTSKGRGRLNCSPDAPSHFLLDSRLALFARISKTECKNRGRASPKHNGKLFP